MRYLDWIEANVPKTYGKCAEMTQRMADAFPELTRVRGHYDCSVWGLRAHWWLTLDGKIIDPTASQFPSKGTGSYMPFSGPEPSGICANCGESVYDGDYCCSKPCRDRVIRDLTSA